MDLRGIQIVGLLVALAAVAFVILARKKGRISGRSFLFWLLFWGVFMVLDLYPSVVASLALTLDFGPNMYILTAGSVLTLFVLVFLLYSFLSSLNQKVTQMVREHAILTSKVSKMLEVMNSDEEKNRNSHSSP